MNWFMKLKGGEKNWVDNIFRENSVGCVSVGQLRGKRQEVALLKLLRVPFTKQHIPYSNNVANST